MKKIMCLLLAIISALGLLAGCGAGSSPNTEPSVSPAQTPSNSPEASGGDTDDGDSLLENVPGYKSADLLGPFALPGDVPPSKLPLTDESTTMKFWITAPATTANLVTMADGELWKELERITGVTIEFIHPIANGQKESFALFLASLDYPDIMASDEYRNLGGLEKAVEDEVFVNINDYKEFAPHLFGILDAKPEYYREVLSDKGYLPHFPHFVYTDPEACVSFQGATIRKDYLDKYGLDIPETYDEYYNALVAFRDGGNPESLFIDQRGYYTNNTYLAGLGITYDYIMVDGKVKYSPIQDEWLTYLEIMNKWYEENLIMQDFYAFGGMWDGWLKTLTDEILATSGYAAFAGDHYVRTGEAVNPDYNIVGTRQPVLNKGDFPTWYSLREQVASQSGYGVTTTAKNTELAVRYLDFLYSSEGVLMTNFGIEEGRTFNYDETGRPILSDLVCRDELLDLSSSLDIYAWHVDSPYIIQQREMDTFIQAQKDTVATWALGHDQVQNRKLPANYTMTAEEGNEISAVMADIETYVSEWTVKFIIGAEPLSKYEEFRNQILSMDVERALELRQVALDRYFARSN